MQLKFVRSADLDVVESTANLLLMNGWEVYMGLSVMTGEYMMIFCRHSYDRREAGYSTNPVVARGGSPT